MSMLHLQVVFIIIILRERNWIFLSLCMLPLNRLQFTFCLDPGFDCKVANAPLFTGKISPFSQLPDSASLRLQTVFSSDNSIGCFPVISHFLCTALLLSLRVVVLSDRFRYHTSWLGRFLQQQYMSHLTMCIIYRNCYHLSSEPSTGFPPPASNPPMQR